VFNIKIKDLGVDRASIVIGAQTPRNSIAAIVDTFCPRLNGSTVSAKKPFGERA
jgi:hypothetical protein